MGRPARNIRREIRKARRRVEVRDDLALDRFHAVWAKTFARQGLPAPVSLAALERLDAACAARGARAMLFATGRRRPRPRRRPTSSGTSTPPSTC